MNEYPDFEQNYFSRTAKSIYKNGHNIMRLMKKLAQYDGSYYVDRNYYDLLGSV